MTDQQTDRQATLTPELKPCPFCASRAVICEDGYQSKWVICDDCGACTSEVDIETIEQAIERWNRRATIESLERENTALRESLAVKEAALRLLVACRDLVDRIDVYDRGEGSRTYEDIRASTAELNRRSPLAWAAARAALQPETPQ